MLPNFARLSLKPTGLFYALTQPEADALNADGGQDPISLDKYKANQHRDSDEATFRVRVQLPNNQWAYETFIAEGLWTWVKKPAPATDPPVAKLPSSRQPIWREDWWALSDRFAPGVPYPQWVRNLPLSDPSVPDTKTYAAAAGPADEVEEGDDLAGDDLAGDANNFLTRASDWQGANNTLLLANLVRGSIESLLRGVDNFNYDERLNLLRDDSLSIEICTKLKMILTSAAPENPVRALADAKAKGYALSLLASLAHNRVILPMIRSSFNLLTSLEIFRDTVLDNDDFNWGVAPNDFGWLNVEARLTRWRDALRVVKHAYYWDSKVGRLLLMPAPGMMTIRALNRALTVAEMRTLDDLSSNQEGVERALSALGRYGARQFFATNGNGACFQLLTDLKNKFNEAAAFPNSITTRNLALRQFVIVINAYGMMELDTTWQQDHAMAAQVLMRAFNQSLEAATTAGRVNRTAQLTPQNMGTHIEEFFWRVAAPRYSEQAAGSFSSTLAVERVFYRMVLLPNWPERPPLPGDPASDDDDDDNDDDDGDEYEFRVGPERSDDEDEDQDPDEGVVMDNGDVIPRWRLWQMEAEEAEAAEAAEPAGPRPGTPMPPSPAPAPPRYNLRSRSSSSGLTPNPRRQRR